MTLLSAQLGLLSLATKEIFSETKIKGSSKSNHHFIFCILSGQNRRKSSF